MRSKSKARGLSASGPCSCGLTVSAVPGSGSVNNGYTSSDGPIRILEKVLKLNYDEEFSAEEVSYARKFV